MGKLIRLRLCIYLAAGLVQSHLAQPYLSDYNIWTNSRSWIVSAPPQFYAYSYFFVGGDSLINTKVYKKIFRSDRYCAHLIWVPGQNYPCSASPSAPVLTALLREVGPHWYLLGAGGQDSLLYRFDLAVGDSVRGSNPPSVYVVDTIINNYNQSGRKLFQVRDTFNTSVSISGQGIIEGVGPTTGFLSRLFFFPFEDIEVLMCFSTLPVPVYCPWYDYLGIGNTNLMPETLMLFPNPTHRELSIRLFDLEGPIRVNLSDATGRLLKVIEHSGSEITLDLQECIDGLYFLEIKTPDRLIRRKFIKHK